MLARLRLGNFKAFGLTQDVPIRPITLIFGANSGGKSSLIHGLLLARHALDTGDLDVHSPTIAGDAVDLGGFKSYLHRHRLDYRVEWGAEFDRRQILAPEHIATKLMALIGVASRLGLTLTFGLALDDVGRPTSHTPEVISCDILADGESVIRMSRRDDGLLHVDRVEVMSAHYMKVEPDRLLAYARRKANWASLADELGDFSLFGYGFEMGTFFPQQLLRQMENDRWVVYDMDDEKDDINFGSVAPARSSICEELTRQLSSIQYLGPLRSYPPRRMTSLGQRPIEHRASGSANDAYLWDMVRDNSFVREQINQWLGNSKRLKTPYELTVQRYVSEVNLQASIEIAMEAFSATIAQEQSISGIDRQADARIELQSLMSDTDFASQVSRLAVGGKDSDCISELVLIDKRSDTFVSHRDVGIGISQVLPVLASAYASENSIVAIEQPELHLHPALQTELADVFIESALGGQGNTFILETHSEHLILRLMRRIRETTEGTLPEGLPPVRPEDVSILYVYTDPDSPSSSVRELRLDEDGEFLDAWPGGFFEEGFRERFS